MLIIKTYYRCSSQTWSFNLYQKSMNSRLSKLLQDAANDITKENINIKNKFKKIANVFINGNWMSAQESAYHVLSIPLSKNSSITIFINTSPIAERILTLKQNKAQKELIMINMMHLKREHYIKTI